MKASSRRRFGPCGESGLASMRLLIVTLLLRGRRPARCRSPALRRAAGGGRDRREESRGPRRRRSRSRSSATAGFVRVERIVPKGVSPERHALRELAPGTDARGAGARPSQRVSARRVRLRFASPTGDLWLVRFSRVAAWHRPPPRRCRRGSHRSARRSHASEAAAALRGDRGGGPARDGAPARAADRRLAPERGEKEYLYSVRGIQLRLWTLGYLDRTDVSGRLDYVTSQALLAFQGWEGLARTGERHGADPGRALPRHASEADRAPAGQPDRDPPRPRRAPAAARQRGRARGPHVDGRGRSDAGRAFRVYRKELYSWSVPFQVWMPYAAYFVGGIATHEYPDVPSYPASHGCVRLPAGEAHRVYEFVNLGTPVHVF